MNFMCLIINHKWVYGKTLFSKYFGKIDKDNVRFCKRCRIYQSKNISKGWSYIPTTTAKKWYIEWNQLIET
jgi:hypothetical protein